jgi:hypothetical protein
VSNRSITGYHLHSYLSSFFISAAVPNGEFPEILIAKCRSRFYCTWFFCWGDIVREINVSRARDPVHAGDKALTRETPAKRGRVNRYVSVVHGLIVFYCRIFFSLSYIVAVSFIGGETHPPAQSHLQTLSHDHNSSLTYKLYHMTTMPPSLTNFITWPQLLPHLQTLSHDHNSSLIARDKRILNKFARFKLSHESVDGLFCIVILSSNDKKCALW